VKGEDTSRLEAFSDGVFAIAITLLILEIRLPHAAPETTDGALWTALGGLWPSYLAFLLSFFVILVMWVNHHELLRLARAVDCQLMYANGAVLLTVTFVPFPTAILAQYLDSESARAAVAFYCGTFFVISLAWGLLFRVMRSRGLLRPEVDAETVARIGRAYALGPVVYLVSTMVAFFWAVPGLLLNVSLWVLWMRLGYRPGGIGGGGPTGG